MAVYRIAIINGDIGKFSYNSMQQGTKELKAWKGPHFKNLLGKIFNL